jgi:hypothetical protein
MPGQNFGSTMPTSHQDGPMYSHAQSHFVHAQGRIYEDPQDYHSGGSMAHEEEVYTNPYRENPYEEDEENAAPTGLLGHRYVDYDQADFGAAQNYHHN